MKLCLFCGKESPTFLVQRFLCDDHHCYNNYYKNLSNKFDYIYFIDGGNGLYKIGYTSDLYRRLNQIYWNSPVEIFLFHALKTVDSHHSENYFHIVYETKRSHGEWFQLDKKELEYIQSISDYEIDNF